MKMMKVIIAVLVMSLTASMAYAVQHQVTLNMWRQLSHSSLRSLNIYYDFAQQKFLYNYQLTDGTYGSVPVDDVAFARESALYSYRATFNFTDPSSGLSLFLVYIYPSSATGDVEPNIAKNAASQAVANNVLICLNDLRDKKNRRVRFYQTTTSTTIDCRYY